MKNARVIQTSIYKHKKQSFEIWKHAQNSHTPEKDMGMWEETYEEASNGTWQEGGGQNDVAAWSQSSPQCHTARVHVDRAGCLLHYTLHPAAAVHLHLVTTRSHCWKAAGHVHIQVHELLTFNTSKPIGRFSPPPSFLRILLSSCCRQISTSSSLPLTSNMN